MATLGAATPGMTTVEGADGGEVSPLASLPTAVAVSVTDPRSTSAWVTVWGVTAVQVSEPPGWRPGPAGWDS